MRVAYIVSRFPVATETFIVRELNGVDAAPDVEASLFALFPPINAFTHPAAERWVPVAHQPSPAKAAAGLAWWALRRPLRLASSVALLVRSYGRSPGRLARTLVTVPIAAAHARTMKGIGTDHVHAHFANYPAVAAWLAGRLLDVPYSVTAHAHDLFVDQTGLTRLIDDAATFVVISEFNRDFVGRLGAHGGTPVPVVHCGVDVGALAYRERTLPADGPVRVLCIAGLQEKKGHAVLFEALAAPGLERIELDLVGSGPLEAELKQKAAPFGDRIRFHGAQTEEQVRERLATADALVLPSIIPADGDMEGIPVALMEALAVGLPAIGSALSGIPELARDGETMLLADPGDAAGLADTLRALLEKPDAARERARAGRAHVEAEFAIDGTVSRMLGVFRA